MGFAPAFGSTLNKALLPLVMDVVIAFAVELLLVVALVLRGAYFNPVGKSIVVISGAGW